MGGGTALPICSNFFSVGAAERVVDVEALEHGALGRGDLDAVALELALAPFTRFVSRPTDTGVTLDRGRGALEGPQGPGSGLLAHGTAGTVGLELVVAPEALAPRVSHDDGLTVVPPESVGHGDPGQKTEQARRLALVTVGRRRRFRSTFAEGGHEEGPTAHLGDPVVGGVKHPRPHPVAERLEVKAELVP